MTLRARHHYAGKRLSEMESTVRRWDGRAAALACARAQLAARCVAAAATVTYAAALAACERGALAAEFARLCDISAPDECDCVDNESLRPLMVARAPWLCEPLSDELCLFGGSGREAGVSNSAFGIHRALHSCVRCLGSEGV